MGENQAWQIEEKLKFFVDIFNNELFLSLKYRHKGRFSMQVFLYIYFICDFFKEETLITYRSCS